MELRQIRFAVAVAEDRHFGRAAARMFIAQPALSQQVRRLERELGARLFDRGARHVRVTPAGEAFLGVARHILRQADEATAAARRAESGEAGSVSIGASLPMAAPVLSLLLRRSAMARPEVRPTLVAGSARELVELVRRRELDVALIADPPSHAGLRSVPVLDDPIVVLLPAHHPLATSERLEVADLRDADFVTVSRDAAAALHDRVIALCTMAGVQPSVALEADDAHLVPVAVAAGLGVGLVPRALAAPTAMTGTTWRPLDDEGAFLPLSAVAVEKGATPQTREFLDLIDRLRERGALGPSPARRLELAARGVARTAS